MTDPAWPDVQAWIREAKTGLDVLPPDPERRDSIRGKVGVSLESALGAIIHETGGILVDHGWLRILGSGHPRLPRVALVDQEWILVADDAVGGFFALHPPEGEVKYLPPDTLEWEGLGTRYSAWFRWCLSGQMGVFYQDYRARGWEERLQTLPPDLGFQIYPPPWTKGPHYYERSWKPVAMTELYHMAFEIRDQLRGYPSPEE